jgi:hypothetical protein
MEDVIFFLCRRNQLLIGDIEGYIVPENPAYFAFREDTVAEVISDSNEVTLSAALFKRIGTSTFSGEVPYKIIRFSAITAASALKFQLSELTEYTNVAFKLSDLKRQPVTFSVTDSTAHHLRTQYRLVIIQVHYCLVQRIESKFLREITH